MSLVQDEPLQIKKELERLFKDQQIVITSGGIGPTRDDLTKGVLAQFFEKKLEPSEKVAELVHSHYMRIN